MEIKELQHFYFYIFWKETDCYLQKKAEKELQIMR